MKLLLATRNKHKVKEIKNLFKNYFIQVIDLSSFPFIKEVKETGKTYFENAFLKANILFKHTGILTLADDSGLEIEYLNNAPGIYSARYAGKNASNEKRINKVLNQLKGVNFHKRKAKFVSCMVLIDSKKIYNVMGFINGYITFEPKGKYGFGYDPIFYVPDLKKTLAELPLSYKNTISHRANALKRIKNILINDYNLKLKNEI